MATWRPWSFWGSVHWTWCCSCSVALETTYSVLFGFLLSGGIRDAKNVRFCTSPSTSTVWTPTAAACWSLVTWSRSASDWQVRLCVLLPEAHCKSTMPTYNCCEICVSGDSVNQVSTQLMNKSLQLDQKSVQQFKFKTLKQMLFHWKDKKTKWGRV